MSVPNINYNKTKKCSSFLRIIFKIVLIIFLILFHLISIKFLHTPIKSQNISNNQVQTPINQIEKVDITKKIKQIEQIKQMMKMKKTKKTKKKKKIKKNKLTKQMEQMEQMNQIKLSIINSNYNSKYLLVFNNWRSIKVATLQINLPFVEIIDSLNEETQNALIKLIVENSFKYIIINGIIPGTCDFSSKINNLFTDIKILLTYHGSFTLHTERDEGKLENDVIKYLINGSIWRIGILKKSNAKWFSSLSVKNIYPLSNMKRPQFVKLGKYHFLDGLTHIGIFSNYLSLKNVINQIAAACLLGDGYLIHLIYLPDKDAPYISEYCRTPIFIHSNNEQINHFDHFDLDLLLSSMSINLYVSHTECYPMIVLESIAGGTPCIISDTSNIYDFDDNLRKLMIVKKHDDVWDIYQTIKQVEKNIGYLTKIQPYILDVINENSFNEWNKFLNYSLIPLNKSIDNYDNYISLKSNQSIKEPVKDIFINDYKSKRLKICYIIDNLEQELNYTLGSLMAGMIKVLTDNNFEIVVLTDIPSKLLNKCLGYFELYGINFNKMKLYNLNSIKMDNLKKFENFAPCYQRSVKFALALSKIQKKELFDIIEFQGCPEIAYELLNSPNLYFPEKIPKIFIRISQTKTNLLLSTLSSLSVQNMKYIHQWNYEYSLVYLMEIYSLLKSDMLISSNRPMIDFFSKFYLLDKSRFSIIPIPFNEIKYPFRKQRSSINYNGIKKSKNFLIYGEQNPIRGVNVIVKASLFWMKKNNIEANFYFIGKNNFYNESKYIPRKYKKNYIFIENSNMKNVTELLKKIKCAIFADRFYSTGIDPYIIDELGLPIITSSIPSLEDDFYETNAFIFKPNNVNSLIFVLNETIYNETKLNNLVKNKYYFNYNKSICLTYLNLDENFKTDIDERLNILRQIKYLKINQIIKEILGKGNTNIIPF